MRSAVDVSKERPMKSVSGRKWRSQGQLWNFGQSRELTQENDFSRPEQLLPFPGGDDDDSNTLLSSDGKRILGNRSAEEAAKD